MRISLYGMCLQAILLNVLLANNTSGQKSIREVYVDIQLKNTSVEEAFISIESKTDYKFNYEHLVIGDANRLSMKKRNVSVADVLIEISKTSQLSFKQVNKSINVDWLEGASESVIQVANEEVTVNGKVTDENGQGLPGVNVIVKGTTSGTITNVDGIYKISAPEGSTLIFSYLGYKSSEVVLGASITVDIQMTPDYETLSEVVVIGFGIQERANVTGAIASVKFDEIDKTGILGIEQLLQGRVSGVQISAVGGNPGSSQNINIRGAHSIQGGSQPLFVIDGIPISNTDPSTANKSAFGDSNNQSPLTLINPSDIESIEVLKDASSAAIYGSRANNGVILITTKKGAAGKAKVSFSAYSGIQTAPNNIVEVADIPLYLQVQNEARTNFNTEAGLSNEDSGFLDPLTDPRTGSPNWLEEVTRSSSKISSMNISASGGSENTKFFTSLGYFDQEGWLNTSRFERYTGKISVDHKISKYVKTGMNINGMYSVNNRVPSHNSSLRIIERALEQRPYDTPYKADGTYNIGGADILRHNGVQLLNEKDSKYNGYRALANIYIEITPFEGFTYKSSVNTDISFFHDYLYRTPLHPRGRSAKGVLIDARHISSNIYIENAINYANTWGDFDYNATFVYSFQKNKIDRHHIEATTFPSGQFVTLASAAVVNNFSSRKGVQASESNAIDNNSLESYIGRLTLNYKSKYLINFALRTDGSSRFADGKRYGTFPSGSFGWRISEESFFPQTDVVSDLKARVSYGVTGSIGAISDFASRALISGGANYNGNAGISATQPANDQLTWETATAYNVGLDAELFNGRVSLNAEVFKQNIDDLLFEKPVHSTSGFTTLTQNVGNMENKGWELGINSKIFDGDLKWELGFNISQTRNEVTKLFGDADTEVTELPVGSNHIIKVGESVSSFFLIRQVGIYQTDDEVPATLAANGIRAGDANYEDLNDDGVINSEDRQVVGKGLAHLYGGITNTVKFKSFDLSIFTPFSIGNEIYARWKTGLESLGGKDYNLTKASAEGRWTGSGTSTTTPRAIYNGSSSATHNKKESSRWIEDGSFFKIKTVTLGYTIPNSVLDKVSISNLRLYFTASNLATFTKYSGFDPEVSDNLSPSQFGTDRLGTPALRAYIFGLNLNF